MFQLKPIHPEAIPRALERAERYRVLNEPWQAESICDDILHVEPKNQAALVTLLLALTDQFGDGTGVQVSRPRELLGRLDGEYERAYYAGVIDERWATASLRDRIPGTVVHDWFLAALKCYERAQALSPPGNDDAVLRWNACVRQLRRHALLLPREMDEIEAGFGDHIGPR